jgi:hypothetical protein
MVELRVEEQWWKLLEVGVMIECRGGKGGSSPMSVDLSIR